MIEEKKRKTKRKKKNKTKEAKGKNEIHVKDLCPNVCTKIKDDASGKKRE